MAADAGAAIGRGQRVGIVAADEDEFQDSAAVLIVRIGPESEPSTLAANLYSALRTLDAAGVDLILARTFVDQFGLTVAIHDRLRRAAGMIQMIT
jgi:voltage-gated potassium channel Kch